MPKDMKVEGDIGKMSIPEGQYAIGHFVTDTAEQHGDAWKYLFGEWFPESGYQPGDGPIFEMYMNDPNTHPKNKHFIDIYLPVKPM